MGTPLLLLEIGRVISSNISLVLRVIQCCAISMLLSSLFHGYGDFPSQIRHYLLRSFMRHTGLARVIYITRLPSRLSFSLAIEAFACVPCTAIAGTINISFEALPTLLTHHSA